MADYVSRDDAALAGRLARLIGAKGHNETDEEVIAEFLMQLNNNEDELIDAYWDSMTQELVGQECSMRGDDVDVDRIPDRSDPYKECDSPEIAEILRCADARVYTQTGYYRPQINGLIVAEYVGSMEFEESLTTLVARCADDVEDFMDLVDTMTEFNGINWDYSRAIYCGPWGLHWYFGQEALTQYFAELHRDGYTQAEALERLDRLVKACDSNTGNSFYDHNKEEKEKWEEILKREYA